MTLARAEAAVLAEHGHTIAAVLRQADVVAARPPAAGRRDGRVIAGELAGLLADVDLLGELPALLRTAVSAAGATLRADPVAAPPYVAIASVGPILRGTLETGRLVVTIRAFRVERDPVRYVRGPRTPRAALAIDRRGGPDTL